MTKTPKKPSFNYPLLLVTLTVPLLAFFIFAAITKHIFFIIIAVGLLFSLFFLIPLRHRLLKKEAEVILRVQDIQERINMVQSECQHEQSAIDSFRQKIVNYLELKGLTEKLSLSLSLEDTSNVFIEEIVNLFGSPDTTIILYLFHTKSGELALSSSLKGKAKINVKSKTGDEFDRWVIKTMQPLLIENTKSDYRFDIEKIKVDDHRMVSSLISVPLKVGSKSLGILRMDHPQTYHFKMEDLRFLTAISDLGAVALENAQLYQRVEQLAIKDGLTDLYLKRYLLDRLAEEIDRHLRSRKTFSFLMIDLDKFKEYNDQFGHVAGDMVLRAVGMLLADFFQEPGMLVSRFGGEEFAVLLPECSKEKALELAENIRKRIEENIVYLRREKTYMTASIGVASFPQDSQIKEELIHKADQALYQAKEKGRNRVCQLEEKK